MFRRVQEWVRGNKKTAPLEKKKHKHKSRPRSKTEGTLSFEQNFDDEFRRNDIEAFDLVLADNLGGKKDDQTNATQQNKSSPFQIPPRESTPTKESDNESVASLVDLVTPHQHNGQINSADEVHLSATDTSTDQTVPQQNGKVEETLKEANLSLDEMATLELLDSVVHDLELSQDFDNPSDSIETEVSEGNVDNVQTNGHDNDYESNLSIVDTKTDKSIDYSEVLGDTQKDQPLSVAHPENWQISGFPTRQKSFRFVSKQDMYLPSPEQNRRIKERVDAPDLPPPDYPQTDDEEKDPNNEECEAIPAPATVDAHSTPVPVITSFSSKPFPKEKTVETTAGEDTKSAGSTTEAPCLATPELGHSGRSQVNGAVPKPPVSKGTARSTSTTSGSSYDGDGDINSVTIKSANGNRSESSTPRRPKPRVTSFKSSSLPPQMSAKPVNEMVRKFENFTPGEAY